MVHRAVPGGLLPQKMLEVKKPYMIYNLERLEPFSNALPFVKHVRPPPMLAMNRTSSNPSAVDPTDHISITSRSPGLTGLANLAWNSTSLSDFDPAKCFSTALAAQFHENRP